MSNDWYTAAEGGSMGAKRENCIRAVRVSRVRFLILFQFGSAPSLWCGQFRADVSTNRILPAAAAADILAP